MADFPSYVMPAPSIITPADMESIGGSVITGGLVTVWLADATAGAWPVANAAFFHPFRLTDWATVYQFLWFVGAVSSGNISVGIYDSQLNLIISAGPTAMSATINAVQELNVTDTVLPPGDYYLAAACSNTTGTVFRLVLAADEETLASVAIYEQTGLTDATLTNPGVPVITTQLGPILPFVGIQFHPVF